MRSTPTVIKKYANRRLYHTGTSAYVTLDDLADMVRAGEEFVVQDAKTGDDITRGVLGQIIFDAESRGQGLLPIAFMRQLIKFYGGHLQSLVPTYLEHSIATLAKEQERFSKHVNQAFGKEAFQAIEDQVRRNMDMMERSMRMFMPFKAEGATPPNAPPTPNVDDAIAHDVAVLRQQMKEMQAKLDVLTRSTPADDPASAPESTQIEHTPAPSDAAETPDAEGGDVVPHPRRAIAER